jgi:dephospho-CoA kinase
MLVIGLTGSIGMGKSVTADMFRAAGVPVHDSDAVVHDLYRGRAAPLVEASFPGVLRDGEIDRAALAVRVLQDDLALRRLEAIIHPMIREDRGQFVEHHKAEGAAAVVLDIPLLYETGCEREVDVIVVVDAPESVQKRRVLARPGMTPAKFEAILAKQMPSAEKRQRAHAVIDTARGFTAAKQQVRALLRALAAV